MSAAATDRPSPARGEPIGAGRQAVTAVGIYLRASPLLVAARLVITTLTGVTPVVLAWSTGRLINRLVAHDDAGAWLALVGVALTGVASAVLPHLSGYVESELSRRVSRLVQDRLFEGVGRLPGLARLEDPAFHDRLRLATQAGHHAISQLASGAFAAGSALLTIGGFVVTLLAVSRLATALVFAAALPALLAQLWLSRRQVETMLATAPWYRRQEFYAALMMDLRAAKEIRLFGLSGFLRGRLLGELRSAHAAERRLQLTELRVHTALVLLSAVVSMAALVVTIREIMAGRLAVGSVAVLTGAIASVEGAVGTVISQAAAVTKDLRLLDHYTYVVTAAQRVPDLALERSHARAGRLRRGIEFRDVWFRYDEGHEWVLRGVSLSLPVGCRTGLVGLNGAGKSTIVKLLCRLYDPQRGAICWDGVDLRDLDVAGLRERITTVFQDSMTYDLTAAENIALGDLTALDDGTRVAAAAERAGVGDMLRRLPHGYRTMLSRTFAADAATRGDGEPGRADGGVLLSGGQWQRIALARAMLRDQADLIIMDEPLSAVDAQAEAAMQRQMLDLARDRTSLFISHRLNAMRHLDQIVVLGEGRVLERGTHDQLMAAGCGYARLFRLQASGYAAVS